ncbi:hypothetical protein [Spirosoma flavum]|uniref:Recombinase RecA n=1 Tax=Spirosoma flavum TaxID=2048557 RepID=A0ABW6ALA6_9BACT
MSSFQLTAPDGGNTVLRSVPLIKQGEEDFKPVLCGGHKLIARGPATHGVSFLTKYLLMRSYRDASVLFVDWEYSFGHASTNFLAMWNNRVMPFQEIEYGAVFSEPFVSVGIKWATLPLDLIDDERRIVNFLINLLERIAQLPPSKNTKVLILERFWFAALGQSVLWESLNYLLKAGCKLGLEIWLLCPVDIYDITRDSDALQRLQRSLTHIPNLFLFDQSNLNRRNIRAEEFWQLSSSEYDILTTVGKNLSPALMPYKEVFFKRHIDSEPLAIVYGIKATQQKADLLLTFSRQ